MSKVQLVITAVVGRRAQQNRGGLRLRRVAQWVHQLVTRYHADGAAAFTPRSGRPHGDARSFVEFSSKWRRGFSHLRGGS